MDLQRITAKLFVKDAAGFDPAALIPVFHGWIRARDVDGLMPIDVADYAHVHEGPGVMLICHEGHIGMDHAAGRLGLLYANKRRATGSVQERTLTVLQRLLTAAGRLESEPALGGIAFGCDEMLIRVDDRLAAPNTADTLRALRPELEGALGRLYDGDAVRLEHVGDPKASFTVRATSGSTSVDVRTLLDRLGAAGSKPG